MDRSNGDIHASNPSNLSKDVSHENIHEMYKDHIDSIEDTEMMLRSTQDQPMVPSNADLP